MTIETARKILFKDVPPDTRVHRAWDMGLDDVTVTWFTGDKILLNMTFLERGLAEIVPLVQAEPFAPIGDDYVRSDAEMRDTVGGRTRAELMTALGLRPVVVRA